MTYKVMAYIVMTFKVMACIVMACAVVAYTRWLFDPSKLEALQQLQSVGPN